MLAARGQAPLVGPRPPTITIGCIGFSIRVYLKDKKFGYRAIQALMEGYLGLWHTSPANPRCELPVPDQRHESRRLASNKPA